VELWPSRSSGLTLLDSCLIPHLQNPVFRNPIDNLQEQQQTIKDALANVGPEMQTDVFNN
jgi:hypothetical protein